MDNSFDVFIDKVREVWYNLKDEYKDELLTVDDPDDKLIIPLFSCMMQEFSEGLNEVPFPNWERFVIIAYIGWRREKGLEDVSD